MLSGFCPVALFFGHPGKSKFNGDALSCVARLPVDVHGLGKQFARVLQLVLQTGDVCQVEQSSCDLVLVPVLAEEVKSLLASFPSRRQLSQSDKSVSFFIQGCGDALLVRHLAENTESLLVELGSGCRFTTGVQYP